MTNSVNKGKQKFNLAASILFCICATLSIIAYTRRSYANPSLYIEKKTIDFGAVPSGTDVRRLFMISNSGNAPLVISQIDASCGCIKRCKMLTKNIINPGSSEPLEIVFNTPLTKKKVNEKIILHTNDPRSPLHIIQLQAEVNPILEFNPPLMNFGIIEEADLPVKKAISIRVGDQKSSGRNLIQIKNDSHFFSADVRRYNDNLYYLDLEIPQNSPLGIIDGSLRLTSGGEGTQPYFVLGKIIGPVYSDPDEIFLQVEGNEKIPVQTFDIKSEGTAKIQNVTLESVSENLKDIIKAEVKKKPIGYAVVCNFDVDVKSTLNSRGSILLDVKLMSGEAKKLVIPIAIDVISMKRAIDNDGAGKQERPE